MWNVFINSYTACLLSMTCSQLITLTVLWLFNLCLDNAFDGSVI